MKLVSFKKWERHISDLRLQTEKSSKTNLKKSITLTIQKNISKKRFGILFSGGIDSSLIALICKKQKANFICYTVGVKDCHDILKAKETALLLNLNLKTREFNLDEIEKILGKLAKILPDFNVVSAGVGLVTYAGLQLAKGDKIEKVFTGLGSDEIFAGTGKHERTDDKHEQCWRGLIGMYGWDFERDFPIAKKLKIKLLIPFLDEKVIKNAMGISIEKKINKNKKKIILSQIASDLGLPKEVAWRRKKASQYGSGFDKAILKLTKKRGFKRKSDYIVSLLSASF